LFLNDASGNVHIGGGADTIHLHGGTWTVNIGHGNDSIGAGSDAVFSVHIGGGHDTVRLRSGEAHIAITGGSDSIRFDDGAATVNLAGGNDTVKLSTGNFSVRIGGGHDLVHASQIEGVISIAGGNDTVFAHELVGRLSLSGKGADSITAFDSTAVVKTGNGNDTVAVSGGTTVNLGNGQHVQFVDHHHGGSTTGGSHNNILVKGGGGQDTFTYEYTDFGITGTGSTELTGHDGAVAKEAGHPVGFFGDGSLTISHFTHKDVLNFDDYTEPPGSLFPPIGITQAEANANMKVTDGGLHHNVTIVIDTAGGSAAGTIVLKGIGTASHQLHSIDTLAVAYHLQFSPLS
jgi:hypothetical protein